MLLAAPVIYFRALGELTDILWANVSAIISYTTFGGWEGAFGGAFNFIEEILETLFWEAFFQIRISTSKWHFNHTTK
jgi:hypothetical protein